MLCLFFLICDGSPTSRDVYCGILEDEMVAVGDGCRGDRGSSARSRVLLGRGWRSRV